MKTPKLFMSRTQLTKRFQAAGKAGKSFTSTLHYKVQNLNIWATFKTSFERALSAVHSLHHLIPLKRRRPSLTRPHRTSYYQVHRKNFAAVRIDDLYAEPGRTSLRPKEKNPFSRAETGGGKEVFRQKHSPESSGGEIDTIDDAWRPLVARSPHLQVDERAEEFISRFREDMKIQKERSLLEF